MSGEWIYQKKKKGLKKWIYQKKKSLRRTKKKKHYSIRSEKSSSQNVAVSEIPKEIQSRVVSMSKCRDMKPAALYLDTDSNRYRCEIPR